MKKYLDIAYKVAANSVCNHKLGAILVKGGSVINVGFNKYDTHKFSRMFGKHYSRHAELQCVLGVDRKVTTGSTVYVVRVRKSGDFGLAKPCMYCQEALKFVGVKKVVYSDNEGKIQKIKL